MHYPELYRIDRVGVRGDEGFVVLSGIKGTWIVDIPAFYVPIFQRALFVSPTEVPGLQTVLTFYRTIGMNLSTAEHETKWDILIENHHLETMFGEFDKLHLLR